jgi:hypothetical protein
MYCKHQDSSTVICCIIISGGYEEDQADQRRTVLILLICFTADQRTYLNPPRFSVSLDLENITASRNRGTPFNSMPIALLDCSIFLLLRLTPHRQDG